MRVTFRSTYAVERVDIAAGQAARARQQVLSGKRIAVPSDDPSGTQRAIVGRAEIGSIDTYARTADSAAAKLVTLDSALTDIVDRITQAIVVAAAVRGTTATAQGRESGALTLEGLRDGIAGGLNTEFRGAYVFGGTESLAQPYVKLAGVWTYQGNNTLASVEVGPSQAVAVALDGQALAQGSDPTNVLDEFETLITAVRAGDDAGVAAGMTALQRAFNRATRTQSQIGVDERSMADRQSQLSTQRLAALTRVAKDEDANLVEAISEMNRAEVAYRAALGAVGSASQASLLDYLR